MKQYTIDFYCKSVLGNIRKNNEDNFFADGVMRRPSKVNDDMSFGGRLFSYGNQLLAVYDGMGGESCGEVASFFCADETAKTVIVPEKIPEQLLGLCSRANRDVSRFVEMNSISTAGSTAAILCFAEDAIYGCNVGDSRIYKYSDGTLSMLSIDHSIMTEGRRKAALNQYIGIPVTELILDPHFIKEQYRAGDIFLICSDGITDMITDNGISDIVKDGGSSKTISENLVYTALQNGGVDNTTIITAMIN